MTWFTVARLIESENTPGEMHDAMNSMRRHWENVALDVGLDPAKNVRFEDNGKEARLCISEEMDIYFRESSGSWRGDFSGGEP